MLTVDRVRWGIGTLIAGGLLVNFADRTVISVAGSQLSDEFGMDVSQLGWVLGAFSWSYCLAQLPAGVLVDRIGVRWLNGVAVVLWGLASLLTATAGGLGLIIATRLLLGVAEGPFMLSASKATASWFPTAERGRATALFDGATKLSNVIGLPVLALVIGKWGWRAGFLFTGVTSLLFAVVWWRCYWDPAEHPGLDNAGRADLTARGARGHDRAGTAAVRTVLRSRRLWAMTLGFACYGYTINVLLTWMPQFFQRQFGARVVDSGLYSTAPWIAAALAEFTLGGWLVDRLVSAGRDPMKVRRAVLFGGLAVGASVGFAGTAESTLAAMGWMTLSLSGLAVAAPVAWSLPGLLAPTGSVGTASGLMNVANAVATAGGVVLTGWLAKVTGSFGTPFVFAVGVLGAGILLYWPVFTVRRHGVPRSASPGAGKRAPEEGSQICA
ncbi:MFS transporter [Streptomyces silvisoli]|uniref:MFS transporter n=1 Tax=Streptomyces silvisoli TaxID=3034235 RepID=A0ABT5ZW19_9ACTN|nr:MFS transporter [Streptomyces silvisoli]MDF3293936.1 MFS transporter [Streptomyces silvisoli]